MGRFPFFEVGAIGDRVVSTVRYLFHLYTHPSTRRSAIDALKPQRGARRERAAPMAYTPIQIANGFLERGFGESVIVDHMKIQKLLFFAHGYYLARTDNPLIDENFQAWTFGPVVPSVYQRLKNFGARPITEFAQSYDAHFRAWVPAVAPESDDVFERVRQFVWEQYGRRPSTELSKLTHHAGGAWDKTIKANPNVMGPIIENDAIKEEFLPLVKREPVGA
jgi:uncharacterized phage-associated protein